MRVVVPMVTFGTELLDMRLDKRNKLGVMETKCLRSMCKWTRMDRLRTEEERRRAGERKKISATVNREFLKWLGHVDIVEYMSDEQLTERVQESKDRRQKG